MKRIALLMVMALVVLVPVLTQASTPLPNSAVFNLRVFNDCPLSVVTTNNSYPASISIADENPGTCFGYANLHNWRFSENGVTEAVFNNDAAFQFGADLVISGTGDGEAGLQISPWWSQDVDGRLNVRTTDGEIACFGGRLPFYSFTANHGLHYVKNTPIRLEVIYDPNGMTAADPASIQYRVFYGGTQYNSGEILFDEGNPSEDPPYGLYGILNDSRVGGHLQYFLSAAPPPHGIVATWTNVYFIPLDTPKSCQSRILVYSTRAIGTALRATDFDDDLPAILAQDGHVVSVFDRSSMDTLTPTILANYEQLWFISTETPAVLSGAEVQAILDFHAMGKGIMVISDGCVYTGPANQFSSAFGVEFTSMRCCDCNHCGGGIGCLIPTSGFVPHEIWNGVSAIQANLNEGDLAVVSTGQIIATDNGINMVAVGTGGGGRVAWDATVYRFSDATSHPNLAVTYADNPRYVCNLARWLGAGTGDTAPPTISVSLDYDVLWPPDHRMVDINATVTVTDDCCATPTFELVSVTSNEPDNGLGDGNTIGDIAGATIGRPDVMFQLRAERSGKGTGRIYTIVYAAEDCVGKVAYDTVQVSVPHDGSLDDEDKRLPETAYVTALLPSYPNPFNPMTTVSYSLAARERVSLQIFDTQGRLVRTLCDEVMPEGTHEVIWNGRDNLGSQVATGVYFVRFKAGDYQVTRKLVMVR